MYCYCFALEHLGVLPWFIFFYLCLLGSSSHSVSLNEGRKPQLSLVNAVDINMQITWVRMERGGAVVWEMCALSKSIHSET